jgi:hypothetical protein
MKLEEAYSECLEIAKEFAFKKVIWLDTHFSGTDWSFGVTFKIGEEFKIFPFYSFLTDGLIEENIKQIRELCNTNTENQS